MCETSFLFGGRHRDDKAQDIRSVRHRGPVTRWAWVETSRRELLLRMAVKFFLHPLATEDMVRAAQEGTTKIDRYRHQYFVSLEVYALDAAAATSGSLPEDG